MPEASPVLEYVVAVEPVFAIIVDQVEPPLDDLSISYPVIAEPPLFVGADQLRLICDDETAVTVRPEGDHGAVDDGAVIVIGVVVADAVPDGELVPTELIADTR